MPELKIRETPSGIFLPIRVQPNAKKEKFVGLKDGVLHVRLASPPIKGAANKRLIEMLSDLFGISKSSIHLVRGTTNRNKTIFLQGITIKNALQCVNEL